MFPQKITIEQLNTVSKDTLLENLGIEFTEIGADFIVAKMPVDERTQQPMGLLHGGASVALAESIGSTGSYLLIDTKKQSAVGLEINANHIGGAQKGFVYGTGKIVHRGKTTHIWNIEIRDEKDKLISICRLTLLILERKEV
ncbi:MAG TPA: thioesterase [Flavobacteriales bacterium]|nr:thioesterase [Crocinitomicaceae bacterium]HAE30206.1 thioesterase [Flavobacteriales bacterium]|tara:strand:- start:552 stop:977 length:426 start_codon:yes stop_codon:yes gene_type:complete